MEIIMKRMILVGITVLFALTSCENFLNVNPETSVTPDNFFETQSDFQQALTGTYAPLQNIYNGNAWKIGEMHSDNTHFIYNVDNRGALTQENIATFLMETNNPYVENKYNNNYVIIARANELLAEIGDADFEKNVQDNIRGQALFLRSFAYFDLVKYFGGVPLHLTPSSTLEETSLPRSSEEEIYNQIISDLSDAVELLPANAAIGRATTGAAYTLLGDVYMHLKRWADAEAVLKEVSDYSLLPNYSDIFKPVNEGNNEMIFEVEFMESESQALYSTFPYDFVPFMNDPSKLTLGPSRNSLAGGWNIPTPNLLEAYEDTVNDERYEASIGFYTGSSPITSLSYENTPYIKKYQHDHGVFGQTGQNWPVYRYAEVLLMLAESLNEQGKATEALTHLNKVRTRAGLEQVTTTDQGALRSIIHHERRIELAFENKRWPDLVRTGRAITVMNNFGTEVKTNPQDYYYPAGNAPFESAFNVTEKNLLLPIPFREININPDLEQNPGY